MATSVAGKHKRAVSMEPMLSNISNQVVRNEPRDLQSRLYREIGISAVAAALEVSDAALERPSARQRRDSLSSRAA